VDTEGGASTDDLATINGGTEGDLLFLRSASSQRTVVLKHGVGNIRIPSGQDFSLDSPDKAVLLLYDGTNWLLVGSAGSATFDALTDTPNSKAGHAGHVVAVNDSETALEYVPAARATNGPVTIYVDDTNGDDDTGDGSASKPFKTIQKGIDYFRYKCPYILHDCVLAIGKGTYTINSRLNFDGLYISGSLLVVARDTNDVNLFESGTATGGGSDYLENSNANWPTDFWAGAVIVIRTGTGAGQRRTITGNTATRIYVNQEWTIAPDSTSTYTVSLVNIACGSAFGHMIEQTAMMNTTFQGLHFSGLSGTNYAAMMIVPFNISFEDCIVTGSGRGFYLDGGRSFVRRCYVEASGYACSISASGYLSCYP